MSNPNNYTPTVVLSRKEYIDLQNRIKLLQSQNQSLKQKLSNDLPSYKQQNSVQIQNQPSQLMQEPKSSVQKIPTEKKCGQCKKTETCKPKKSILELKEDWSAWSKSIESNQKFKDLLNGSPQHTSDSQGENFIDEEDSINEIDHSLKLVQQVCIYGPNQQQIKNSQHKAFSVNCSLYQPSDQKYQSYGSYLFPDQVPVKRIRHEKQSTETNRIIFKKNPTKNDTAVFMFQAEEKHPVKNVSKDNELLNYVNPGKKLYVFAIPFYDYLTLDAEHGEQFDDLCNSQRQLVDLNQGIPITLTKMQKKFSIAGNIQKSDKQIDISKNWKFYTSKFYLCIFTYFPLVNLYEKVLLRTMDQIKIKRMQIFTQNPNDLNRIDMSFVVSHINQITSEIVESINSLPPELQTNKYIKLGHEDYLLDLSYENLPSQLFQNWASQCLRHFTKDALYDILCYMLLEESLCFVSQDLHVLTYVVLLFSDFLLRPLSSPHPVVSVAFKQQLLGTPFIVTLGVNKPTQWLQDNLDLFADNKVIVDLNEEVSIRSRKKPKFFKSEKLKKSVSINFKKNQILPPQVSNFFKRKESFAKTSTEEENQNTVSFANSIRAYFEEEVIAHLPPKEAIKEMKAAQLSADTEDPNQNSKEKAARKKNTSEIEASKKVMEFIEDRFSESRKRTDKDQLIEAMAKQQLFYVFLCETYCLK